MYALEQEPEKGGRMKRFGVGIAVVIAIFLGLVFGSRNIVPAARALTEVVELNVIDEPDLPKPKDEPPPPPPPPPDAPKPKPKMEPSAVPAPPDAPPPPSDAPPPSDQVGLDADSFGTGSGGAAFAVGSTQMGTPGTAARSTAAPVIEEQKLAPKPQIIEARPHASNGSPKYNERARKLGIQGLMVIEADIDVTGKVTRAVVRGKLDPQLDAIAHQAVLGWRFDPATLAGRAVASTKFLRIRFQLE